MIVVTGGAGFIGSNLVRALNERGREDLIVVDDLTDGRKFVNLAGDRIADYLDKDEFRRRLAAGDPAFAALELVYHLGACSDTTEWNGRYMLEANYAYSRDLLEFCQSRRIPLVYASSAAVYGTGEHFTEDARHERPLNVYGYSKLLFDQAVRRQLPTARAQIVGVRYFNVYGPHEQHKERMASVVYHFNEQLLRTGTVKLFGPSHGMAAGEQRRDFVHVADAVDTTLWLGDRPAISGIFNCGSGGSATFNAVASAVIACHGRGEIEYIPFPADLANAYQNRTEADLSRLRDCGYRGEFRPVARGVPDYLSWLNG